jgi:hypothetical protein
MERPNTKTLTVIRAEAKRERQEQIAWIVQDRPSITTSELAKRFGVSKRVIQRDRKAVGVSAEPTPSWGEEKTEQVLAMLDDGASYVEISRTLGVGEDYVREKYPGRGWTKEQMWEYNSLLKRYGKYVE